MGCLKKYSVYRRMPVVRWIQYVYNSCMGPALMSLYIPAKKCILTIDEGPFLCNCFLPEERAGVSLHPLITLWLPDGTASGKMAFYAHARPLGGRDKWPDDLDAGTDWCHLTLLEISLIP